MTLFAPRPAPRQEIRLADAAPLLLWRDWLPDHAAVLAQLVAVIPWEQHELRMPVGLIPAPRLECWFATDEGRPYVYTGERYLSRRMGDYPPLPSLAERVARTTGVYFDALFANLYRTGRDSIGWHSDAEVDALGPLPEIVIASLSLGVRRRFAIKHRSTEERVHVELGEGDLLLMGRGVQSRYLHSAPKTAGVDAPRLNLTFRRLRGSREPE